MQKAKRFTLLLHKKLQIHPSVLSFSFQSHEPMSFAAGQYLQLTLPHTSDDLGTNRFFSISSAPSEKEIVITVKKGRSSFKQNLFALEKGDEVAAFGPLGKFTLED